MMTLTDVSLVPSVTMATLSDVSLVPSVTMATLIDVSLAVSGGDRGAPGCHH